MSANPASPIPIPRALRWETLTKKQFDAIDRSEAVVFVTCSPMEVHGPHLPLGADCLEGEGLAEHSLRFLPEHHRARTFLRLPFVWAACDGVPQPGTVAFRASTTMAFLRDMGRSLAAQGFRNVMVSNFHGSPRHFLAIERACDRVSRETGIRMVSIFSLMLSRLNGGGSELGEVLGHLRGVTKADFEGDTHGGLVETSQLLALHPDWVDPDYKSLPRRTVELWVDETGRGGEIAKGTRGKPGSLPAMVRGFKSSVHYFAAESYAGAPAKASAELGEEILDTLAGRTAEAIAEILDGTLPPEQWHSPFWKLRHIFVNRFAVRFFDWLLDAPRTVG
jgi:creatinine amidohydrolase/Fe(II)-dependent formamide hydrolase-like protein